METALVFLVSLALVSGGVPKDRFDPCIFIDCSKFSTKAPTTPSTTTTVAPKSEDIGKFQSQLVAITVQ